MKAEKYLGFSLVLVSLIFLFFSVNMYYRGFHNVDLVYNYRGLEKDYDCLPATKDMGDFYEPDKQVSLMELYIIGHDQQEKAFYYMFLSGIFLTLGMVFAFLTEVEIKW